MTEIEKPQFPNIEEWNDENGKVCKEQKHEINNRGNLFTEDSALKKSNLKSEEDGQTSFKTYNKRRLSDSFPDVQHLITDSANSTCIRKKLSKFLPLLLIQGLTRVHVSERDLSEFFDKIDDDVKDILQSLVRVLREAINTPSEKQTLEYCQTVLEEAMADVNECSIIFCFLENLLSKDPLLKQAALSLVCSYCSGRQFKLPFAADLLKNLISLYSYDDPKILELSWNTVNEVIQNLKLADQKKIVPDICLAVRLVAFESNHKKIVPGLSHSEGFDSIFSLYEKVILKGIMKEKKIATIALCHLIMFSTENALQPFLCSLASLLISTILKYKDDCYLYTKIELVKTLTMLLAKVGIKLKLYFPRIQDTFLTTLRSDNRALQLSCIKGLCCYVHFVTELDSLYECIVELIRVEGYAVKRLMLFALRCITKCAGIPSENSRQKILIKIFTLLDCPVISCRIVAAGCVGTMLGSFPASDCEYIFKLHFLEDNLCLPWNLRHSKCTVLMVVLKENPAKLLLQEEISDKICSVILSYLSSAEEDVVISSIKACGYFMLFKLSLLEGKINPSLLHTFCQTMNTQSEEVKCTFASVVTFLANRITMPLYVIIKMVYYLIIGACDGNNKVKTSCEFALVAVLNLYKTDEIAEMYLTLKDDGTQIAFKDVFTKLKLIAERPKPKEEELDFTLL